MTEQRAIFSLGEFMSSIQLALEESFPTLAWVSAEILSLTVNRNGHCYMELVEKDGNDPAARFTAQTRGVVWRSRYAAVEQKFHSSTGLHLQGGMKVLVAVRVSFHPVYGMSLQIEDIDPVYTIGDMERQKQATIDRLRKDGVWDMNRMAAMPMVPQRIAVVSSSTAAGYRDFMKELQAYAYRFHVTLFESSVQGPEAEEEIAVAMQAVFSRHDEFDCVAIVRGGGATTDLSCFNSYHVASIVAQFPIPVLTGIGHDKDTSVTDMVSYLQLKTPTAVAGWIVEQAARLDARLDAAARRMSEIVKGETMGEQTRLESMRSRLHDLALTTLQYSMKAMDSAVMQLSTLAMGRLDAGELTMEHILTRLAQISVQVLDREERRLSYAENSAHNFSPARLLHLGYSIARYQGRTLRSVDEIEAGDCLSLQLKDGTVCATVKTKQKDE